MNGLKDKVILITGAGKGSGRLLAKALAERGGIVAANDISPINVEELVDHITTEGGRGKAYIEDVAKKVGAQHLIKQVEDELGCIDVLINHAAVQPHIPLLDMDEWDWHRVLDVNLTGAFLMMQSVGRVMRASSPNGAKGSGVIINLITVRQEEAEAESAFIASMSGLDGLTRQAARELSPYGIQVHMVRNHAETVVENVLSFLDS